MSARSAIVRSALRREAARVKHISRERTNIRVSKREDCQCDPITSHELHLYRVAATVDMDDGANIAGDEIMLRYVSSQSNRFKFINHG
jgi:hypothetical protein